MVFPMVTAEQWAAIQQDPRGAFVNFGLEGVRTYSVTHAANDLAQEYDILEQAFRVHILLGIANVRIGLDSVRKHRAICNDAAAFFKAHGKRISLYTQIKLRDQQLQAVEDSLSEMVKYQGYLGQIESRYRTYIRDHAGNRPPSSGRSLFIGGLEEKTAQTSRAIEGAAKAVSSYRKEIGSLQRQQAKRKKIKGDVNQAKVGAAKKLVGSRGITREPKPEQSPPAEHWHLVTQVGEGGEGKAHLHLGVDCNSTIVARVVEKSVTLSAEEWNSLFPKFCKMPSQKTVPLEWYTQTLVGSRKDTRFSLKTLGDAKPSHSPPYTYTLSMPYVPHGTLHRLMQNYQSIEDKIPEEFVWLVFQALAETAVIMKKGALRRAVDLWPEVVHRDLKPDNIFLDAPDANHFPDFPRPLVADYGFAMVTSPNDASNPTAWTGVGTWGYTPPEQWSFVEESTKEPIDDFKILSPCNVWGIGATIASLMIKQGPHQPLYLDGKLHELKFPEDLWQSWNNELMRKVEECLRYEPAERPSVEELLEFVNDHIRLVGNLKSANEGQHLNLNRPLSFQAEDDDYKLGMTYTG